MLKQLDQNPDFVLDHLGLRLWRAHRAWQAQFATAMRAAGHEWFTEARAGLLGHVSRAGTRQSVLIERLGITKQAVQQLLDGLEAEGIVERGPDAGDGRNKIVRYTGKGLAALQDGERIKFKIEMACMQAIGRERFGALMDGLNTIGGAVESKHENQQLKAG